MEEVHRGLLRALAQDWRGGVTCRVIEGARVGLGEPVVVISAPASHRPRLPG
jgi:MOSC domain-containing protein YiiM